MKIIAFLQRESEIMSISKNLGIEDYRAPLKILCTTKQQLMPIFDDLQYSYLDS